MADNDGTPTENNSGHPAWNQYLEGVPDAFRPMVSDAFSKWDADVNNRFQSLHSEYEPFKELKEQGLSREELDMGVQLVRALSDDPEDFYRRLGEAHGFAAGQGTTVADETEEGESEEYDFSELGVDISQHPLVRQLSEQVNALTQGFTQQQQAAEEEQQAQQLEQYLSALEAQHGQFDRDYVTSLIAAHVPGEEAVKRYQSVIENALSSRQQAPAATPAPTVLGSTGGVPTTQTQSPGSMSKADRVALAVSMLTAAKSAAQ